MSGGIACPVSVCLSGCLAPFVYICLSIYLFHHHFRHSAILHPSFSPFIHPSLISSFVAQSLTLCRRPDFYYFTKRCVCMFVCSCAFSVCESVRVCVRFNMRVCTFVYACACSVSACVCAGACSVCACMCACACSVCVHACICACLYLRVCVCMFMYVRARASSRARALVCRERAQRL